MQSGFKTAAGSRGLKPANGERGFALLVVFLVAAGIMISLYLEIPRVGFESQRNREEMLIERGEQYSRAIEMFYRKNKRYPQKIEDLENTNNLRFLRRRYIDPLTGKDEWRMIHMGPAGQLADSLVEKPGQPAGQQLAGNLTPAVPTGGPPNPDELNLIQNRIRASDRNAGGRLTAGNFAPGMPGYDPNNPNGGQQPQQQQVDANGNPIFDPNQNQNQNQTLGFNPNNPNGQTVFTQAGQPQPGYNPNFPGQPVNFPNQPGINPGGVQPGNPGQTVFYQNGGQPFSPGSQLQGQLGAQNGQNPAQAGFGQNPALAAINNQLRNQNGFPQPGGGFGGAPGSTISQMPPGSIRLPDGSYKLPDGTTMKPDGTIVYPDGTPKPATLPQGGPLIAGQSGFGQPTGFGTPVQTTAQTGPTFGGAGIAGVASNQAGVGIKRYNDHSKYKEWEFVFDYRKPKTKAPAVGVGTRGPNDSPFGKAPTNPK